MVLSLAPSANLEVESPPWWVDRLWARLVDRQEGLTHFDDYYSGRFPLPWLSEQAAEEFRLVLRMCQANYMGLVVDAQVERMFVDGFRLPGDEDGDGEVDAAADADNATWDIWQANDMDGFYPQGLLEASIGGMMYLSVAPNAKDKKKPHIWVEHASQAIVEHVPGTNRREVAASLKVWDDDWTGRLHATLQLPGWIYKYEAAYPNAPSSLVKDPTDPRRHQIRPQWEPRVVRGEEWPARNPLGEVGMFESPNNPRLLTGGRSELADLWPIQDRVNKTLADRIVTQDYGAFPQRWASAWPETDGSGVLNPTLETGRNRIVTTDVAETRFGQWAAAELDPYSLAKREDVKDIASRSRTPAQYLLGEMSNVNGDTLKASESGLVAKVRQRCGGHADPLERAMRMARKLAGLAGANDDRLETIWRNPEFRTEGELMDSLVKARAGLDVPIEACWERWGATPTEIRRWRAMNEAALAADPTSLLADRFRLAATLNTASNALTQGTGGAGTRQGAASEGDTGTGRGGNPSSSSVSSAGEVGAG